MYRCDDVQGNVGGFDILQPSHMHTHPHPQVIQQRQEAIQWLLCQPDVMVEVHALLKQVKDVCQVVRGRLMPSQVCPYGFPVL